jgi:acyl-coenzyme A synthetase/AMP-(fatty) acid ligase
VAASETIARDGIAWGEVAWTRPAAVQFDRNGPEDRAFMPPPADFTERSILDLLCHAAAPDPGAVAIVGAGERLTYAALLDHVRRIARYIAAAVPVGGAVATLLPSSPTGFAGILGCLVAARVCIVLDPAHPRERNVTILQDAKPATVLLRDDTDPANYLGVPDGGTRRGAPDGGTQFSAPDGTTRLGAPDGTTRLGALDGTTGLGATTRLTLQAALNEAAQGGWIPPSTFDPDEPALVHYTSGSTGRPKGTVISTRAALRRALFHLDTWRATATDRMLSTSQASTNSGFCVNLAALFGGIRVLLHSLAIDGARTLFALACDEGVTLLHGGPSILRMLFALDGAQAAFARVRVLRSGGDALLRADLANWRAILPPDCHIAHAYASTEAMFATHWFVPPHYAGTEPRLPAGYPLADQDYALIDETGRIVPPGQPGELVLRSRHIACGEWRDGRCVPGRMQPDPSHPEWRMLRTGDLLRLGPDGMLHFVSRADRQLKINGVRVEPAEIETVLRGTACVLDAVVVARQHGASTVLVAYVAAEARRHGTLRALLRDRLRAELPPAMRPTRIVLLERMPYLPGGKIDVHALADTAVPRETLLHRLFALGHGGRRGLH